jgi:aminoglycoside 6-adenylyltransferase
MTRLPDRGDLEARIAAWSKEHDFVRAAILTSTRAMPRAVLDNFSDIDVILAVTDITPLFQDRGWLSDFGEVLVAYRDPIGVDLGLKRFRYVTQYADGSKIDFTIWPAELVRRVTQGPGLLEQLDIGYRVLVDKDHLTEGLQPPSFALTYLPRHHASDAWNSSRISFSNPRTS